jgi:hypothetical protein
MNIMPGSSSRGSASTSLSNTSGTLLGWIKVNKTYADFSIVATEKRLTIYTLPIGSILLALKVKASTAFSGGGAASCGLRLGITGAGYNYEKGFFMPGIDLFPAVAADNFTFCWVGKATDHTATEALVATLNSDVNINTLDHGVVDIWLLLATAT